MIFDRDILLFCRMLPTHVKKVAELFRDFFMSSINTSLTLKVPACLDFNFRRIELLCGSPYLSPYQPRYSMSEGWIFGPNSFFICTLWSLFMIVSVSHFLLCYKRKPRIFSAFDFSFQSRFMLVNYTLPDFFEFITDC